MTAPMRFLSVCSGIEAASVAWEPLGWQAAAFAEIDPFASAVLAHHYPDVPNLGDMTRYQEWPDLAVDLVCGGTPCQAFSVAGLRAGLADPRGNLALTFLAIVDRYRPKWVVWENVPGVLSSNGGRDFASFLGGLGQLGYGWAYRVLDAQYVRVDGFPRAVPQRRRRVFVVGHSGGWAYPAAVLSEPESVCGDTPPRRTAGEGSAADVAPSLVSSGRGVERTGETRGQDPVVAVAFGGNNTVRRLTPLECERLMGFPDDYTLIPYRGKPAADGPRYKALGNSWAVNVARWVGQRIQMVEEIAAELNLEAAE